MILCEESYPEILDQICSYLTPGEVELLFINKDEMREKECEVIAKFELPKSLIVRSEDVRLIDLINKKG